MQKVETNPLLDRLKNKNLHVALTTKLATFGLNKYAQEKSISPTKKFVQRLNGFAIRRFLLPDKAWIFIFKESKNYPEACKKYTKQLCFDLGMEYTLDMIPINLSYFARVLLKIPVVLALNHLINPKKPIMGLNLRQCNNI